MNKLISILILIITVIQVSSFAISNYKYELEKKFYTNQSFLQPLEMQKEKDFFGNYINSSYVANIATLQSNPYSFEEDKNYKKLTAKNEFEMTYSVSPVYNKQPNLAVFNCYSNIEFDNIDDRYYSIPLFTNDPRSQVKQSITPAKIIDNNYRIIPAHSIILNIKPNSPESNYNYFKIENGELVSITNNYEIIQNTYKLCIESINSQYATVNKEGVDITYKITNLDQQSEAKIHAHNLIRRSSFGAKDGATTPIDLENKRNSTISQPSKTIENEKQQDNYYNFIFYVIPFAAFICLLVFAIYKLYNNRFRKGNSK
jgi:hypothetical protein